MPTYVCSVRPGLIDETQKSELARAITRLHHEHTGAPGYYVQVVIEETTNATRYLGGEPANQQLWIRGDIRSGRTVEQRSALIQAIARSAAGIAGLNEASIWVYLCQLEPTDMLEFGHVLPLPGQEQAWFEALPAELKEYLSTLGTKPGSSPL